MDDIEIGRDGTVTVAPHLKGSFMDPTIQLKDRLLLLGGFVRSMGKPGDDGVLDRAVKLIEEAADIVASARTAANRRAAAQGNVQGQLHNVVLENQNLRRENERLRQRLDDS